MVRIVRRLIVGLMAAVTVRRQCRVIVVHMALRTRNGNVEAGQRERSQVVIESRLQPRRGVVAHLAGIREAHGGVRRVIGAVVVRHVTSRACRIGQIVVAIHVTLSAGDIHMETGQREARR